MRESNPLACRVPTLSASPNDTKVNAQNSPLYIRTWPKLVHLGKPEGAACLSVLIIGRVGEVES